MASSAAITNSRARREQKKTDRFEGFDCGFRQAAIEVVDQNDQLFDAGRAEEIVEFLTKRVDLLGHMLRFRILQYILRVGERRLQILL